MTEWNSSTTKHDQLDFSQEFGVFMIIVWVNDHQHTANSPCVEREILCNMCKGINSYPIQTKQIKKDDVWNVSTKEKLYKE